jgi:hypothetical protein
MCRFSDAGVKADPPAETAGVRKAPRHEVAVGGALAGSERYGDLRLAPRSIMGGTLSRRPLDMWGTGGGKDAVGVSGGVRSGLAGERRADGCN